MPEARLLDVIAPVFREEEAIGAFHAELTSVLDGLEGWESRITYVLDPSPDRTEEVLAGIAAEDPRVRVLVLSRRFGHQAALIAGLDHVSGDAVVMLDSDLQHPPRLIPELLQAHLDGADIVQTLRQEPPGRRTMRNRAGDAFYRSLSSLSSLNLDPGSADFRLLSARVVEVFQQALKEQNPFVRGLVQWVGFRVAFVPFQVESRVAGASKYRLRSLFEFAVTGITAFSKTPVRVAGITGFVMSLLSLGYGAFAILAHFTQDFVPPGWTSTLAVVSLVGGIQLFFLGLIAEYVGYIFDEVKARPRYLVETTYGDAHATIPPLLQPTGSAVTQRPR